MVAPRCWPWCLIVQAANLRQERTKPSEGPCQKTRKSLAVAQTSDERAARLFPQNIATRRAPLAHRFFDDGGEPARDAAEEVMAGIDQLVGTRLRRQHRRGIQLISKFSRRRSRRRADHDAGVQPAANGGDFRPLRRYRGIVPDAEMSEVFGVTQPPRLVPRMTAWRPKVAAVGTAYRTIHR
jgi:hypothetical protein